MTGNWGDLAIEKGYITEERLDKMLTMQQLEHYQLSQSIINSGYMTYSELENAFKSYQQDSGLSDEEFSAFRANDIESILDKVIKIPLLAGEEAVKRYILVFAKSLMRFVDITSTIGLIRRSNREDMNRQWIISQQITGETSIYTGFSGDAAGLLTVASGFGIEKATALDEDTAACLGEFLNCVNGIYVSSMYDAGYSLELLPQETGFMENENDFTKAYTVPFELYDGEIWLYLAKANQ